MRVSLIITRNLVSHWHLDVPLYEQSKQTTKENVCVRQPFALHIRFLEGKMVWGMKVSEFSASGRLTANEERKGDSNLIANAR